MECERNWLRSLASSESRVMTDDPVTLSIFREGVGATDIISDLPDPKLVAQSRMAGRAQLEPAYEQTTRTMGRHNPQVLATLEKAHE